MADTDVTTATEYKFKHHLLVVDRDDGYGESLCAALNGETVRSKHTRSVDDFLDLNCDIRVDLVLLEIDVFNPATLDDLRLLRTHFGEGPSTRIVAVTDFAPAEFPRLLQQRGADNHLPKQRVAKMMANTVEDEIRKLNNRISQT